MKEQINTGGDKRVTYYNSDYEPVEEPESWRRLPVNAFITIRAYYIQKAQAGFLVGVTHILYGDAEGAQPQTCHFL